MAMNKKQTKRSVILVRLNYFVVHIHSQTKASFAGLKTVKTVEEFVAVQLIPGMYLLLHFIGNTEKFFTDLFLGLLKFVLLRSREPKSTILSRKQKNI